MSKQPFVVVVGSTMIDMVAYVKKVPHAGETVTGDSFGLKSTLRAYKVFFVLFNADPSSF